jgi:tetratricopeptide (TPR) repeat protein
MDPPDGIATQVAAYAGPTGLNLPAADALAFDEKLAAVREIWDHAPLSLLIFDNLDAPAVLDQWRPQGPGARVLITSRRQTWPAHSAVDMLALDVLPRPASQTLLLTPRALQQSATVDTLLASDGPVAHKVCDELGDFPLALALAAAYLEAYPSVTLANYLAEVRSQVLAHDSLDATLDAPLPTKHAPSIVATFALSYNQLKPGTALDALARKLLRRQLKPGTALDALALKLLHRAAHAAATPIPAPLLVRLADRDVADPHAAGEVSRAVNRLAALGLVERLPDGSARLHRLLAAYARHRTPTPATDASALEITLINTAYQLWEAGYPQAAQPYLPHLGAVATTAAPRTDPQAATLLNTLAGLLQDMGDYAAARPLVERALAIREQTLGPAHPATASSLNNLAELLRAQGDYAAARPLYDRAFDISDQTLGPTHRQTASTLNNLASLLHAQGAFPAAHFLYARALADHEQTLGPAHPATAGSLSNLARLLRDEGDYAAARPLADRALAIDEATYGPTHPAVATDLNYLASLLADQGDYAAARPLLQRALAIAEQTLGTHPNTQAIRRNLLSLLLRITRVTLAAPLPPATLARLADLLAQRQA